MNSTVIEFDEVCGEWVVEARVRFDAEPGDEGDRMTPPHGPEVNVYMPVEIISVLGEHGEVEPSDLERAAMAEWISLEVKSRTDYYEEVILDRLSEEEMGFYG